MAGINKVILVGNVGKDPEVRYLEGGTAVANFSIATSENFKDRNTGEKKSTTEWQPIDHGRTMLGNHPLTSAGQLSHIANLKTGLSSPKARLDHEEVTAVTARREAAARKSATYPKGI